MSDLKLYSGLVVFLVIYLGMLAVSYIKGKKDGNFQATYCSDCLDELEHDGLCQDCRQKLYGEMQR